MFEMRKSSLNDHLHVPKTMLWKVENGRVFFYFKLEETSTPIEYEFGYRGHFYFSCYHPTCPSLSPPSGSDSSD